VSADRPCGEDLAFSSEIDAIARARQADDPSLEQGAWVTDAEGGRLEVRRPSSAPS
jgi:type VI secretion system protein ImpA